ncbi:MAG: HYR domain-containing protein, partial [Planctomycetota bacterium]
MAASASHGIWSRARIQLCGVIAAMLIAPLAIADVSLELRTSPTIVAPGDNVEIELYAVGDGDLFTAAEVILTWNPSDLQLTALDNTGTPFGLFSGFNADPFGLNEVLPLPQDGNAFYQGLIGFFDPPIAAAPAGTLLTTFRFVALPGSAITTVDIPAALMGAETAVVSEPDALGNVTNIVGDLTGVTLTVLDCTSDTLPPEIDCPDDITDVTCTDTGTVVTYDPPTATDLCDDSPTVSCSPPSGSAFAVGTTTVTCTATDADGNSATCTFTVTVLDDGPPTISCPIDMTVAECAGPDGTVAYFPLPTATDLCDAAPVVTCDPPSGSVFAFGTTTVTCTATDSSGNTDTCTFDVVVVDETEPVVSCPDDILGVECDTSGGAVVEYTVTATDACDGDLTPTCSAASGSVFPVGTTTVTCTATDSAGNTGTCSFDIEVVDTADPEISCPDDMTVECSGTGNAVVEFEVGASDACDPDPTVVCVPAPGSTFPLGTTLVTCTATDASGNTSSCTFSITVEDTTPPDITCPDDITGIECESGGTAVTFDDPVASDVCGTVVDITCVPASGSLFTGGVTTVTCTATDSNGNTATCTFTVTVDDTSPPALTCPDDITDVECAGPGGSVVNYTTPTATDDCDDDVDVQCDPPSGSTFTAGTTVVTCTATDDAGNTATCTFSVTVVDETDPELTCPDDITGVECTGAGGAVVTYDTPVATDDCDAAVAVACSPASGSTFPIGTTTVTCRATDDAGNTATCTFTVTVVDTTDPELTCPDDPTIAADDNCLATVPDLAAAATATDACDDDLAITQSPAAGATIGLGATVVTLTATDDSGNQATCMVTVTVEDQTAPEIVLLGDNPVYIPLGGVFTDPGALATDNCDGDLTGDIVVTGSVDTGTVGSYSLTYEVEDAAGNTNAAKRDVFVVSDAPPQLECPPTVELPAEPDVCQAILPDLTDDVALVDGEYSVILDKANQLDGNAGTSYVPNDTGGNPAPVTMTARTQVDDSMPFDPDAPGSTGSIVFDNRGAGVQTAGGGGGKEITGTGGDRDEELIFTFDMPPVASSIRLGINEVEFGNGLNDKD